MTAGSAPSPVDRGFVQSRRVQPLAASALELPQMRAISIHWLTSRRVQRRWRLLSRDVVGPGDVDAPLPLGRPVMKRRDRDTAHAVDFFRSEHLTVGAGRDRHVDSLKG
jgi:hypothetical protein